MPYHIPELLYLHIWMWIYEITDLAIGRYNEIYKSAHFTNIWMGYPYSPVIYTPYFFQCSKAGNLFCFTCPCLFLSQNMVLSIFFLSLYNCTTKKTFNQIYQKGKVKFKIICNVNGKISLLTNQRTYNIDFTFFFFKVSLGVYLD